LPHKTDTARASKRFYRLSTLIKRLAILKEVS